VVSDVPFIDSLQKLHTKQVGWMPAQQLEEKIKLGHVIVAEERETTDCADDTDKKLNRNLSAPSAKSVVTPLGYCIGNDQYFKRDHVGVIYQMNVVPGKQRGLIGATLLKAMFDRAAYGCRLFCCWCAQDIEANQFWESLGFIPLAFRAGSRGKGRVHIFWQKRIRAGDTTTPYWFPSHTNRGSIREDRLVFPIPPDTHWSDAKQIILPREQRLEVRDQKLEGSNRKKLAGKRGLAADVRSLTSISTGGLRFVVPKETGSEPKPKREPKVKVKNDPRLVAAARELRDRWLEQVNARPLVARGKYEVSRALEEKPFASVTAALPAPIAA
jgi:hypothetical protein